MDFLDMVKYIGSFILIVGLIFMVFYILKKTPFGRFSSAYSEKLKFLSQLSLGPKKHLVVVQFLNKILLIGLTETQIVLLGEATKDEWAKEGSDIQNIKDNFNTILSSRTNSSASSSS